VKHPWLSFLIVLCLALVAWAKPAFSEEEKEEEPRRAIEIVEEIDVLGDDEEEPEKDEGEEGEKEGETDAPPDAPPVSDDKLEEDFGDAPPPPPLPEEGDEPKPEPEPEKEPDVDTRPAAPPPVKAEEAPPPSGLNPFVTGLLQTGVGCLTQGVCNGIAFLGTVPLGIFLAAFAVNPACAPAALSGLVLLFMVQGALVGGTVAGVETVTGDAFGKRRGALLWPMLSGCAVGACSSSACLATAALPGARLNNGQPLVQAAEIRNAIIIGGTATVIAVGGTATFAAPALIYGMTASDKRPGDGGFRLPALVQADEPSPEQEPAAASREAPPPPTTAMAF
jgi:hypothetical protein